MSDAYRLRAPGGRTRESAITREKFPASLKGANFGEGACVVEKTISSAELARIVSVRGPQLAWLMGAGVSAAAGIPTAGDMALDFKARIFCGETKIPRSELDPGDPLWRARIEDYFKTRGTLPPPDDPTEYSKAFEATFPNPEDRRRYIEDCVRRGTPSFGNRVVGALIAARQMPCIFSTNFDGLVEQSATVADSELTAGDRVHLTVAALDSVERAERCIRDSSWPMLAKLHGDYQSDQLKNTDQELQKQDTRMRQVLQDACRRFGLVVVGYSGRDASVLDALIEVAKEPRAFPNGIFWVRRSTSPLLPKAAEFLAAACAAGHDVAIVAIDTFDELAGDLADNVALPEALKQAVHAARPKSVVTAVSLPTQDGAAFPVLRCSALPVIELPKTARLLTIASPSSNPELRSLIRAADIHAVVHCAGTAISAFGYDDALLSAFGSLGARLNGTVALDPAPDSGALGLLYDALVRALCRSRPLRPRLRRGGHYLIVSPPDQSDPTDRAAERRRQLADLQAAYSSALVGTVPDLGYPFAEGVKVRLDLFAGRWWCVFEPFTHVDLPKRAAAPPGGAQGEAQAPEDANAEPDVHGAADWRRERWARRYNPVWAKIIDAWAHLLAPDSQTELRTFWLRDAPGVDATFRVSNFTAWSRPGRRGVT